MTTHTIPQHQTRRNRDSERQRAITDAGLAYKTALFAFADGRIPWVDVLDRCRQLRAALRRRRDGAAA